MPVILFLRFTTLESRLADLLSADVELNRNVPSVCVASCSTVRVSGGLKSSWGRVVRRHSSVTFLSCYSHQTALNNQSLFAEIRIGLHWNAAEHLAPDKISQNTDAWEFFFLFLLYGQKYVDNLVHVFKFLLVWAVSLISSEGNKKQNRKTIVLFFFYFPLIFAFLLVIYWIILLLQDQEREKKPFLIGLVTTGIQCFEKYPKVKLQ